ncbi:MAG: T9SS type A sorting domain-containing protein [Candidatus Delongbacteria bacterium]
MKNKILIFAFLIFSLLFPTHAQSSWSDPVQVSGIYWCGESAITYDSNGVLYAFWRKSVKLDIGYYGTVYFSKSYDGGATWTAEQNITPDYNEVPVWEIRAVTDSKDNIHIIYAKGLESKVLVYKKYDGSTWTDDHVINISLDANMRFGIDATDRLFATWSLNNTGYFMYCDTNDGILTWSIPKRIHPDINYHALYFLFDYKNDIYAIGTNDTLIASCVYEYSKIEDKWFNLEQVYDFGETNLGCAITLSQYDTLLTNTAVGSSMLDNNDFQNQKYIQDSTWSIPVDIKSTNNDWDKKMFIDSKDIIHLFEVNIENDINSLNHTYGKGTSWQTETIHTDPDYYIFWFDVKRKVFEEYVEYYVLYCKGRNVDGIPLGMINYQTKRISTGIEDQEKIPESTVLKQNYPNPFNNSTQISYSIPNTSNVKLSVYNIKGELIKDIINARQNKGQHSVIFEANDLNSGIYFYRLVVDGIETENRKMLYLK